MSSNHFVRFSVPDFFSVQTDVLKEVVRYADADRNGQVSRDELVAYRDMLSSQLNPDDRDDMRAIQKSGTVDFQRAATTVSGTREHLSAANSFIFQFDVFADALGVGQFQASDMERLARRDGDSQTVSESDVALELARAGLPAGFMTLPEPAGTWSERMQDRQEYVRFLLKQLGNQDGEITVSEVSQIREQFIEPLQAYLNDQFPPKLKGASVSAREAEAQSVRSRLGHLDKELGYLENLFSKLQTDTLEMPFLETLHEEERRIIEREQMVPSDLLLNRSLFNVMAAQGNVDFDVLAMENPLPHRQYVTSAAEQAALDQTVLDVAQQLDVRFTQLHIDSMLDQDVLREIGRQGESLDDFSTRVMIASSLVSFTKNRPDLLASLLRRDGKNLRVVIGQSEFAEKAAGFVTHDKRNELYLGDSFMWSSITNKSTGNDAYNLIVHEAVHLLESEFKSGFLGFNPRKETDGILPGLSQAEKDAFVQARTALKTLYDEQRNSGGGGPLPTNFQLNVFFESHFSYGLGNDGDLETNWKNEFLATTVEYFMSNPTFLNDVSPELYQWYVGYFGFDPLLPPPLPNPFT